MYASDTTGTVVTSSAQTITIDHPAEPLKVSCPTVAAPNVPYSCGFANIPGSGNLTIKYDEVQSYEYTPLDDDMIFLGNIPPRNPSLMNQETVGIPSEILDPTILANGKVDSYTKIVFVEWYGGVIGSPIDLYVKFDLEKSRVSFVVKLIQL